LNSSKLSTIIIIALTVAALTLTVTTLAAITITKDVPSSGSITTSPNLGVYSNSACTNTLNTITWGSVTAGGSATQTVYVKNTGTGTITLSLATSAWAPSGANTYITVSWDKQGATLTAGQSTAAILTLTVSSSITGISSFNNTITISGTG
jgi:hypothetical protein